MAKNVFQVHGVDQHGKVVLKKQLRRHQVAEFFAHLPSCLIGMEACGSAHYWARRLQGLGHTVRLISPQFVKPYVKTNKNDAADAEGICEAVGRPNMRFVPVKNVAQQGVLALHRLGEFGVVIPQGIAQLFAKMPEVLEDATNELPDSVRALMLRVLEHLKELARQAKEIEAQIAAWHRDNELSSKLAAIPGIGLLSASALSATVGMRRTSPVDDSWLRGWGWSHASAQVAARACCWA